MFTYSEMRSGGPGEWVSDVESTAVVMYSQTGSEYLGEKDVNDRLPAAVAEIKKCVDF
jgi:hypothetical protein